MANSETRHAPEIDAIPQEHRGLIPMFKYQHFEPYVMTFGTLERQVEKAEAIVEWWPGWISYCLEWCQIIIKEAEEGVFDRDGVEFPMDRWVAQRDVFQAAMDAGKFIEFAPLEDTENE